MNNKLYLFVEGNDDERFFNNILERISECTGINQNLIFIIPFQQKKNSYINKQIKKAKKYNDPYFFITDKDSDKFKCYTQRKQKRFEEYKELELNKIVVVNEEIESWYFSGLKNYSLLKNTENLSYYCSKEDFNESLHSPNDKIQCLVEIMEHFDFNLAIKNNDSFRYFIKKTKENFY
ncbi:MAG: hypothetical protein LBC39_01695 [Methanobrevibacter sp.]|jgi:hypothetical protein|nr:hypothetical protein [Candidatus Methanovirga aequatorialis]